MAYDEEQKRSRVVVETPTTRREVVHTQTGHIPERRGVSTGVVAAVAITAIALTAIIAWALTRSNQTTDENMNVRVATSQPTPVQQQPVIIQQQPAPQQQQPVVVQQPPQTVVVPVPGTSAPSTSTSSGSAAPRTNGTDDATVQLNIDKKLRDDQTFSALGISATVIDGKVTLIGTVDTPDLKRQAERLVKSVKGVQIVDNQIIVSGGME